MRNGFIYLLILVAIGAIFWTLTSTGPGYTEADLSDVLMRARSGQVSHIEVQSDGDTLIVTAGNERLRTRKERTASVYELLEQAGVNVATSNIRITVKETGQFGVLFSVLLQVLPMLFLVGLFLFIMRQAQGTNNQALSFGKSRARVFTGNRPTITFNDVAGYQEVKQELQEVVEFLKSPERFAALGARIPRGLLLVGPPGTGKTFLSRAVAGEAGVPFFSISGSEFVEMFVGVGASRVRDLFEQAKRNAPCIVFVDEIDAVGRQRGTGLGGSHDEREQTLNQILVEMDGFDTNTNVIVIAATNRPDILDPALLRPGRFDRQVVLDRPDVSSRKAILEIHAKGKPLDSNVDLGVIAKQTPGFTGADLANLVNEAAILAARYGKRLITSFELGEAVDRVIAGPERKSKIISPREKEMIAYHEAGHALVGRMLKDADQLHKISIVSRGAMGGYTRFLPEEERSLVTRSQFKAMLAVALGGHVAEDIVFDEMTTGPSNDIENLTNIARQMVMRYGMSERLGPRTFGRKEELIFLAREMSEQRNYSEKVAEEIDEEVRRLIADAYEVARQIIVTNRETLDRVATKLIEVETLEGDDLVRAFEEPSDQESQEPQQAPQEVVSA
jgi:cell division protease FtsH